MAISYTYNDTYANPLYVYTTTGGGTVFSANQTANAAFDYFANNAVVNDAIYFSGSSNSALSNLKINVGTPLAGTGVTGVWEYWCNAPVSNWRPMHDLTDPSNGFTVAGSHTIVFPIQVGMYTITVNGITGYCFIRYRITGGTVTEGGANSTARVTVSNGFLSVNGATDVDYATFENLYNWTIANAPEVHAYRSGGVGSNGGIYEFRNCQIQIISRLKSTNQQVFFGCGAYGNANLNYLEAGTKVGTNGWKDSSSFFFCYRAGGNILIMSTNTKIYGGTFSVSAWTQDGVAMAASPTYLGTSSGEIIGLSVESRGGYFSNNLTADRCTFCGEIISTSFPTNYPTNMRVSNPSYYIWGIYGAGGTVTGTNYALPSTGIFSWNQQGGDAYVINMIDCSPLLPEQSDVVKGVYRTAQPLTASLTNVLYWDSSANAFADYTAQAASSNVDDVPLTGDAGDCYYFRYSAMSSSYQMPLKFTITDQANDYEYIWEYYYSGSWRAMNKTWDYTNNLTTSGIVYNSNTNWTQIAINSVTGYWYRLRIVTKGATSPKFSMVKTNIATGVGDWRIYEKMSSIFTIQDEQGNPIPGATVKITDNQGTEYDFTANASGVTGSQNVTISAVQFDPLEPDANYNIKKTMLGPVDLVVSAPGFQDYTDKFSLTAPLNKLVTLERKKIHTFNVI